MTKRRPKNILKHEEADQKITLKLEEKGIIVKITGPLRSSYDDDAIQYHGKHYDVSIMPEKPDEDKVFKSAVHIPVDPQDLLQALGKELEGMPATETLGSRAAFIKMQRHMRSLCEKKEKAIPEWAQRGRTHTV